MMSRLPSFVVFLLFISCFTTLLTPAAFGQCPPGTTAIIADRDNTLYEDPAGMLSNGEGTYFFAGHTGMPSNHKRRGLLHFDISGNITAGLTINQTILRVTADQPGNNGTNQLRFHRLLADWGEASSFASMGQGGGATAQTGDATWLNTFFGSAAWTTPGGDFDPTDSGRLNVDSIFPGVYSVSSAGMAVDAQSWLDTPATNFGWLVLGSEHLLSSAIRLATRENIGNEPVLCVRTCGGATTCDIFGDGFESGDTSLWDSTVP